MTNLTMKQIYKQQLRLAKSCSDFVFYKIVYPIEVDAEIAKLKLAGINYKKVPVIRNGQIVAYKIQVKR